MKKNVMLLLVFMKLNVAFAQERIFANYFDIAVNSPQKTEVTGRIHLERNKDVLNKPIPRTFSFVIAGQNDNLFNLETCFDTVGRIMGVLTANQKITAGLMGEHKLSVVLKDGTKTLTTFPVTVKVVKETLLTTLYNRYRDYTVSNAGSRMYGRQKYKDEEVVKLIAELEENEGKFKDFSFYGKDPAVYKSPNGKTIEFEWAAAVTRIGGLGYAHAKSAKYGPKGNSVDRERLKNALYLAIIAYTESVPVEGSDVMINGKPIGVNTGDGFANLIDHKLVGHQVSGHQWVISDPLIAPSVHLLSAMQADRAKGNKQAERVYYNLVRFFQTPMAESPSRRKIDNPEERWGMLRDTLRSSGAWADANLGHRSRWLLAMPIVWADYNRPLTYVQYWYADFYHDKPFKNFSYSYGWSPQGVVADVARWMTKYRVPAHHYAQSGFQPDGTISHHVGEGTDMAMFAYGFEWLTDCYIGFNQFKNTDFRLPSSVYQFSADRLEKVYPKFIYKNRLDFLSVGRSYGSDLKNFVNNAFLGALKDLEKSKSDDTQLSNQHALGDIYNKLKQNSLEVSVTEAFWVNEYLIHRRGKNEKPYFVSLKLKSKRTVGAEDFEKVRKSWYAGYGILPLKVTGDEYSEKVLANFDWHVLPGLTEEWRTDAIPTGSSQASLPGDNDVAGVTANGKEGLATYHHLPREKYSSATAQKSYYFIDDKVIALGNNIKRLRPGQQKDIVTTIDQSAFLQPLSFVQNGETKVINPGQSVNISYETDKPFWLHNGEKGYIVYPEGKQRIMIKTGSEINITDKAEASQTPGYIIAISHGAEPVGNNGYNYFLVPNVSTSDMPKILAGYQNSIQLKKESNAHGVYSNEDKTWETAFFQSASLTIGGLTVKSATPALMILKDNGNSWTLTMSNPAPSLTQQQLVFNISQKLKPGTYKYQIGGINPREGEFVTVTDDGAGSKIVAELPDKRDDAFYCYQTVLYNATPITIKIQKQQ